MTVAARLGKWPTLFNMEICRGGFFSSKDS